MLSRFALTLVALCACLSRAHAAEIIAFPLDQPRQGAILVTGDITVQDRDEFLIKIAPFSSGVVMLDSRGGSAYAGIEMGKAIRMRGFTTWVPSGSLCASACAMAWLGGTRRLMGKNALIGFHSVYQIDNGKPIETGSGNALYGAYLSQLGLSDRAIMYLSDAAPTSMNWLTPAQAESFGIALAVFDPKPNGASSGAKQVASLDDRASDFIIALYVLVSGPTEKYLRILAGIYADQAIYYGKETSREDIVAQITRFTERWPNRSYTVRPDSLNIDCDGRIPQCRVTGLIDFDAKSSVRNQRSHGTANIDYLLIFRQGSRWPVIISESGKVVTRQIEPLNVANDGGTANGEASSHVAK